MEITNKDDNSKHIVSGIEEIRYVDLLEPFKTGISAMMNFLPDSVIENALLLPTSQPSKL